ncbi:hypothetical protein HPB51_011825 [Rhipicephalus microplus]|uniref:Tick transposon n=1 Tax=Rhipicephalus microplus TaxID=6941 RepID=A0A9J6E908_RHIMP|nr:hypothetical protein HPB51_011825 [Rhipicephalus microplus]
MPLPDQTAFRRTLDYVSIRHKYGQSPITRIRKFLSASTRPAAFKTHLRFNVTSKSKQLIPKSLQLKHPVKSAFGHHVIWKAERQLLQAWIEDCKQTVKRLETDILVTTRQLEFIMPELLPEINLVANQASRRRTEKQETSQERKLSVLLEKGRKTRGPMFEVRNLSSYELTPAECQVLSRGLNFNQAKQPDTRKNVCAVENAIGLLRESERDKIRTKAVGILSRIRKSGCQQVLSEDEEKVIKPLHKNKKITVLPADKGNVTVVLDRSTYESKMTEIAGDCTTYAKINKDPTSKVQTGLRKTLSSSFSGRFLHQQKVILPAAVHQWFCSSDIRFTEDSQKRNASKAHSIFH